MRTKPLKYEAFFASLCLCLLIFFLRSPLLLGSSTFAHDNFYWNFPLYHFFADTLLSGHLPLWNPYSHAGEAFYPAILQIRLLDPILLLVLYIGHFLTKNLLILYHWTRVIQSLFFLFGIYLVLRSYTHFLRVRLALMTLLFFSSTMLGSFHADGVINNFLWSPLIFYFFLQLFYEGKTDWKNWLALSAVLGMNFQSYFFVLPMVLLFFLSLLLPLFHRDSFRHFLHTPQLTAKILFCSLLLGIMLLPNIVLWTEKDRFIFPARLLPEDFQSIPKKFENPPFKGGNFAKLDHLRMPYSAVAYGGAFSNPWDFVQLLAPEGNPWIFSFPKQLRSTFGKPSECYLYFGMLPWLLILVGLFLGKQELKFFWLSMGIGFALLSLGPAGLLHRFLYAFFPPLWFLRHLQFCVLYVSFCALYFFVLGFNFICEPRAILSFKNPFKKVLGILVLILSLKMAAIGLLYLKNYENSRTFFWLAIIGTLLYTGVRVLGKGSALAAAFVAHCFVVYHFHSLGLEFILRLFSFVLFPVLLSIFLPKRREIWILLFIVLDLTIHFKQVSSLYDGIQLSPEFQTHTLSVPAPKPVSTRSLYPHYPPIRLWGSQRPRYLSNIYRESFAFSKVPRTADIEAAANPFLTPWWDALYLPQNYFELLNSQESPIELKSWLGISSPIFMAFENRPFHFSYLDYSHNKFRLSIEAPKDTEIFWSDGYDPYWTATLDGNPWPIHASHKAFKSFSLPKGNHEIALQYQPTPFLIAVSLFFGAWGLLALSYLFFQTSKFPFPKLLIIPTIDTTPTLP